MISLRPFAAALLLLTTPGLAGTDMVFFGTLNAPPPCTIDDDQLIDVDFGERVGVNKVDGQNYIKTVNYRITCEPGSTSGFTLGLKIIGTPIDFDSAALQTNIPGLGIRLLQNGQPLQLNQRLKIEGKAPELQAVPVKKPGVELKAGAFTVTATMLADYQ
ncbi:TPA: fimbrial protein [Serratia marcescens]